MRMAKSIWPIGAAVAAAVLCVSPVLGGGWNWDRDAGAKARGEFGGRSSRSRSSQAERYRPRYSVYPPSVQSRRSFSYQPEQEVQFKVGDVVTVVAESGKLMRGSKVIATVEKGRELVIVKVVGGWLGTSVEMNGEKKSGWISMKRVAPKPRVERPRTAPPVPDAGGTRQKGGQRPARKGASRTSRAGATASDGSAVWISVQRAPPHRPLA